MGRWWTSRFQSWRARLSGRVILIILFALIMGLAASLNFLRDVYKSWTTKPLPQLEGQLYLKDITKPVYITRDQWGVPYINAFNMKDLAFAQGYVMAQDRLWQMDMLRRAANGELAAILGHGENNAILESDKLYRSIGLNRLAVRAWQNLPLEYQDILNAYARGVNSYIDDHVGRLPFEFHLLGYRPDAWQPTDSLVIEKFIAFSLSSTWKFDLMRAQLSTSLNQDVYQLLFTAETTYDHPIFDIDKSLPLAAKLPSLSQTSQIPARTKAFYHDLAKLDLTKTDALSLLLTTNEVALGSNNWVISGQLSATGKPILANDPHQPLSLPAVWYQNSLKMLDGSYQVTGVSIVGVPGIVIGHNAAIAWGVTNLMADVQDLYIEEFDQGNLHRYRVGNEIHEAEVIREYIQVRPSIYSVSTENVEHEVLITRHGPIIGRFQNRSLALKWTGLANDSQLPATFKLNRAQNWTEFCAALKDYSLPVLNYVYADVVGNIGYYGAGQVPIRSSGNGALPYDGHTNEGEWTGYIPFEEMPHLYNPPNGYIETANQCIVGEAYKYHLANDWAPPYRAYRLDQLLAEKAKQPVTMADMQAIQMDVYAIPTKLFVDQALQMATLQTNSHWQSLKAELTGWDGYLTPNSRAAAIAVEFRQQFSEKFFTAWLGNQRPLYNWYRRSQVIDLVIKERNLAWLPKEYPDYDTLVIESYQAAISKVTAKLGTERQFWQYGEYNSLAFNHPLAKVSILKSFLNPPSMAVSGSPHTINATDTNPDRFFGPSMRMIISLANWDDMEQIIVPGQSGQVASPHYADQLADWAHGQLHSFPFSNLQIEKHQQHKLILLPKE